MKYIRLPLILFLLVCFNTIYAENRVKIACVGNSITFGATIQNRELNSYPAQLQAYLGEDFEVKNFGVSATTLLKKGNSPYKNKEKYKESLDYMPDIVFIKLGTNDSKPQNRIYLDDFKLDYLEFIESYRNLPSKPRVVLLTPVRCFIPGSTGICDSVIQDRIAPVIKELAYEQDLDLINLYYLFGDKHESYLMPDQLHPSSIGAGRIAAKLYDYIRTTTSTEKYDIISNFPLKPTKEFNFHGFKGYTYNNNGIEYKIVKPHQVATGNPWIWRSRFWGHEPQTEISLLEKGFHLTFCDVSDLYGSDKAIKRWDSFYQLATEAGLNKKVVLEGMSRGGLIIYNWATKNPEKVACIYADAPVLDIKSWPVGKSEKDTEQLLKAYDFKSQDEALEWTNNPVDNTGILAKAGIPMLHVVGDDDTVVPVTDNTELFASRLEKQGFKLEIIHKPGIGHHPHSLVNPEPIVRFILKATGHAENMCVHPIPGNEFRSAAGWREGEDWHSVAKDITTTLSGKQVKILMLGNSITQGLGGDRKAVKSKLGKEAMDKAIGEGIWESAGISGDRTQHLLWRLQNGNYNICKPNYAIITIGINNVSGGDEPSDIAEGIMAVAKEAKNQLPSTQIIVLGVLPAGKEKDNKRRIQCNKIHEILAASEWGNIRYLNPSDWFIYPDGSLKTELYGRDFLHLSKKGYEKWSEKIAELIN